jgi:formylglycine-generating enzyme required for sulfatase activity
VKFRVGPGEWRHAWLAPTGHLATGGTAIGIGSNGGDTNVGAYVYLSNTAVGAVSCPGMRLKWAYTKNGLAGTNSVDISVHGIEMVYMPASAFSLGSGGTEFAHFFTYPDTSAPYAVTSEAEIPVGATNGYLHYVTQYFSGGDEIGANNWRGGDGLGPIPAACPKGFAAMYCMKHEISQGQYADFLNYAGGYAATYFFNANNNCRHTIHDVSGVYVADAPDRACSYLSWDDLAAYLDWAALRPMTELEFEKACRGPLSTVANEYAWGNTAIVQITGHAGSDGSGDETAMPVSANANYAGGIPGPVRVGIFATTNSTRYAANAGYYGALDLGGNVHEIVISIGHPDGRAFTAQHGDGQLVSRPSTWPSASSIAAATRGGSFSSVPSKLGASNREGVFRDSCYLDSRRFSVGGRGVRSAP